MNLSTSWIPRRPHFASMAIVAVGVILTVVVVSMSVADGRRQHVADLASDGHAVANAFAESLESVTRHLVTIDGLFGASDIVTPGEFRRFVSELGLPEGAVAVGYAARTSRHPAAISDVHPGFSRADDSPVFGIDAETGERVPLQVADHHDILIFIAPSGVFDDMLGLDLSSVPSTRDVIDEAVSADMLFATPAFEPVLGFEGSEFLAIAPVGARDGLVDGFAVAMLDLDLVVARGLIGRIVDPERVEIDDVTGSITSPGDGWMTVVTGLGRQWRVEVIPSTPFSAWTPLRLAMLAVGVLLSVGAAALVSVLAKNRRALREIERLAAAREQTDRLLSDLSHQLRTPLTVILGFLDEVSARWDVLPERDRLEMLDLAERGALDMGALVDDLLVRERMIAGVSIPVTISPLDVAAEVEAVIAELEVPVELRVSGSGVPVMGDRHRVRQVFRNLIENAVRHGEPPVEVAVETSGTECVLIVRDGGTGVPECCQVGLFDLEVAQHRHDHPRVPGQGVGLPVARFLVEAMGGELFYDAAVHDFVMRLPIAVEGVVAA